MGPRLFRRGDGLCGWMKYSVSSASMGPRLFRRGDARIPAAGYASRTRASMGPRLFRRGDRARRRGARRGGDPLQWGHAFSGVETSSACPAVVLRTELQWGHAFSGVETPPTPPTPPPPAPKASMGPRLFRRGDADALRGPPRHTAGFNGATPFQAWRRAFAPATAAGTDALQWGHAFSGVETAHVVTDAPQCALLQWGHAFSGVETVYSVYTWRTWTPLQWGHAFSGVETR